MKRQTRSIQTRLALVVLLPLTLILAACEVAIQFDVREDNTATMEMVMALPKELAEMSDGSVSCEALAEDIGEDDNVVVTDESTDRELRCVMKSVEPQPIEATDGGGVQVTRSGDEFITHIPADPSVAADTGGFAAEFSATFTYPGAVQNVETTLPDSDYTITGNQVRFTSIDFFNADTVITASADPATAAGTKPTAPPSPEVDESPSAEVSSAPSAEDTSPAATQHSTPVAAPASEGDHTVWWVGGIIVALFAGGAITFAVMRAKQQRAGLQPRQSAVAGGVEPTAGTQMPQGSAYAGGTYPPAQPGTGAPSDPNGGSLPPQVPPTGAGEAGPWQAPPR